MKQKGIRNTVEMYVNQLVSLFHKVVAEGPTHVCICCDQLWCRHSVQCVSVLSELKNSACKQCICVKSNCELGNKWICRTCLANLRKNKIPRCATVNKMGFPYKPKNLDLTELEWRLVQRSRLTFQLSSLVASKRFAFTSQNKFSPARLFCIISYCVQYV